MNYPRTLSIILVALTFSSISGFAKSGGVVGTGGGNGVARKDGKTVPLEVMFAEENESIDPKVEYPAGYLHFRYLLGKISKVMPTFAKDLDESFSRLNWTRTSLELIDLDPNKQPCINNIGQFKISSDSKQPIIACQKSDNEVVLSKSAVQSMPKQEYIGVIFLHEAFVNRMLAHFSDDYSAVEEFMITKIMPYIISYKTLDAKRLYEYARRTGFHDGAISNRYYVEAFQQEHLALLRKQEAGARASAQDVDDLVLKFSKFADVAACDKDRIAVEAMFSSVSKFVAGLVDYYVGIAGGAYSDIRRSEAIVAGANLAQRGLDVSEAYHSYLSRCDTRPLNAPVFNF
jgi:hypothetical protein